MDWKDYLDGLSPVAIEALKMFNMRKEAKDYSKGERLAFLVICAKMLQKVKHEPDDKMVPALMMMLAEHETPSFQNMLVRWQADPQWFATDMAALLRRFAENVIRVGDKPTDESRLAVALKEFDERDMQAWAYDLFHAYFTAGSLRPDIRMGYGNRFKIWEE